MKTKTLMFALLFVPVWASAQTVHTISTASAVSSEPFKAVGSVRELPNGKVLVNDILSRRLLLMDSTMHLERVVLDSTANAGGDSYGVRPGALIPYRADTTLFIDPASYSMQVIDGSGKIVRQRSVWRAQDAPAVASVGMSIGQIGVDGKGRVVYRLMPQMQFGRGSSSGSISMPSIPDSAFIVAADPDTRKIDTLGVIRVPAPQMHVKQDNGRVSISPVINPLPITDEWAVTADGNVAFVRGRDYRIEYLHPDGTITSSAKLPFDWQRLSDDDKKRVVDSTMVAQQKIALNNWVTDMIRWANQTGKEYPADFKIPDGFVPSPGLAKDAILPAGVKLPANYLYACPPSADGGGPVGLPPGAGPGGGGGGQVVITRMSAGPVGGGDGGNGPTQAGCVPAPVMFSSGGPLPPPTLRTVEVVDPSTLPDYRPPFPAGSVRADRDGNLWIRTNPMKPITGGPIFDVVNSKGELIDKIQLPIGYSIVGFGKDKVVYLTSRDDSGIHIARVHLK